MGEEDKEGGPDVGAMKEQFDALRGEKDQRRLALMLTYWGLVGLGLLAFFLFELFKESVVTRSISQADGLNFRTARELFDKYETGEIDNLACACNKTSGSDKVEVSYQQLAPGTFYAPYTLCVQGRIQEKFAACESDEECRNQYSYKFLQLINNFCENGLKFASKNLKTFFKTKLTSRDLQPEYIVINQMLDDLATTQEETSFQVYSPFKLISTMNQINNPMSPSWFNLSHVGELTLFQEESQCSCSYDYECKVPMYDVEANTTFSQGCDEVQTLLSFTGRQIALYIGKITNSEAEMVSILWNYVNWISDEACYDDEDNFVGDPDICFKQVSISEQDITLDQMVQVGFIPTWSRASIQFDAWSNYFKACSPPKCDYTEKAKGQPYEVITVVLGVWGGISSIFSAFYDQIMKRYDTKYGKKTKESPQTSK